VRHARRSACISCRSQLVDHASSRNRLFWWFLVPIPLSLSPYFRSSAHVHTARNPTLSYTQRLENRIKELEDQVARISKSPSSTRASSSHSSPPSFSHQDALPAPAAAAAAAPRYQVDEPAVARRFRGLKMDDKGAITYHGATSFFHLPTERPEPPQRNTSAPSGGNNFLPLTEVRRERLVSNAWQQRALENLSEIPVSPTFSQSRTLIDPDTPSTEPYPAETRLGTLLTSSQCTLVLDTAAVQLCLSPYIYS
jgi:hypothetical protein